MDNVSGEYEKSSTLELKEALPHNHLSGIRIYAEEYEICVLCVQGQRKSEIFSMLRMLASMAEATQEL